MRASHYSNGPALDDRLAAALMRWAFALLQSRVNCRGPTTGLSARLCPVSGRIGAAADCGKHEHSHENRKNTQATRHGVISSADVRRLLRNGHSRGSGYFKGQG